MMCECKFITDLSIPIQSSEKKAISGTKGKHSERSRILSLTQLFGTHVATFGNGVKTDVRSMDEVVCNRALGWQSNL
jgi:hypothetical protein